MDKESNKSILQFTNVILMRGGSTSPSASSAKPRSFGTNLVFVFKNSFNMYIHIIYPELNKLYFLECKIHNLKILGPPQLLIGASQVKSK